MGEPIRVVIETEKDRAERIRRELFLKAIWKSFLAIIPIVFFFILFASVFKFDLEKSMTIGIIVGGIIDILFLLRKKIKKWIFRNKARKKDSLEWERISELPNWAFKRMNRKHKNKVRGEHYVYMRNSGKYYRKKYK